MMNGHRILFSVFALVCMLGATVALEAQQESYDDVMLVINERSWASRSIGAFFANRRGVPERNIYRMNIDTAESIDSARFVLVKWQMQKWMRDNGLVDSINYIVTTKGCPLRVRTSQWDRFDSLGQLTALGGQASFEDCIALMNGEDSSLALAVKFTFPINRYYNSTERFRHDPETMPIYLVTRLDGYTVDKVQSYIVRAETPAVLGDGLWVLDVDPGKDGSPGYRVGNDWLRGADEILRDRNMDVLLNSDTAYVRNRTGVVGYASWGSNDGHSGGRAGAVPHNTWLNGSIAETFVSTGGRTFNTGTTGGQSLIADWIEEGACGVKGYTDEPYLSAIAHPDILFDRYTAGFNMAESFWAASIFSAWRQVVIGDPKMRLGTMLALSSADVAFGSTARGRDLRDTVTVTNNLTEPLAITALTISGVDAADFEASIAAGALPASIPAGGSVDVVIAFAPTGYGSRQATLEILHRRNDDVRDKTIIVQLSGSVVRPAISAATSYDFGAVLVGTSAEHVLEIASTQPTDTLFVTNFSKSGAGAPRFSVTSTTEMPAALTGGATLGLRIAYEPSGATRDSATLTVYTLNGGSPARIKLYGSGALSSAPASPAVASLGVSVAPNPAGPRSEIHFALERPGTVRIELLDLLGRTIENVANARMGVGEQSVALDLGHLAAGTYLCRVEIAGDDGVTRTHVEQIVRR